ncbi:MAG: ABC transporter ATP-binding protein [Candidatus Zixiibacteriota bacterium]|nr:MAG: ABC transporter ATP-binding protein [candidate division Zixibacteria bacterium]
MRGLAKSYPGRPVFKDINAVVDGGNLLIVTGPNGSGKTTLLRIICGLIRPTRGSATLALNDRELRGIEIRRYIGLVSPDLVLYDELTALENLYFFGNIAGLRFSETDLENRLRRVGLDKRGNDKVGSYSSGMKQRLKYCLALLRNPELLLLDEPTSNLDDEGKALVSEVIKSHKGIAVIATNEKSELDYGDQIIRLGR